MKRVLSLILVLVMSATMLIGCGNTNSVDSQVDPTITDTDPTIADTTDTVSSRDTVNLSINAALTTCDPHATYNVQDKLVLVQMYEALLFYDDLNGKITPELALSYEVSDDGMTYTFKLRDDVYFHNGDQMTAEDVVFSIMRASDPSMAVSTYATNIVSAEVIDETTVAIHLSSPYAPFLSNCCQLYIVSEREVTEQAEKFGVELSTAGTGPYKMTLLDNDAQISFEAFNKYYRGEAAIKHINYYPITDRAAGLISFESGELDWYSPSVMDALRIESEGKFNVEMLAANHITFAVINCNSNNEALQNEKVRQAMAYAINKEEMNMAAFEGAGLEADYFQNPDWNVGAPRGDVVYNYNVEKAKSLLTEAGYPNGVNVGKILCFKGSHFETCATVLQAQLKAVGIEAELEWAEQAASIERLRKHDYDIGVTGCGCFGDYDDIRKRFYSELATPYVDFTVSNYDYKWMDEMIDKSASCTDPDERLELTKELNDYFMKTATYIPMLHKAVPCVSSKDLNVVNRPNNLFVYEWSWN